MKKIGIKFGWLCMALISLISCKKEEETILEISSDYVTIDSVGGAEKVFVTTNKSWEAVSSEDWVTLVQSTDCNSGELSIAAFKMTTDTDREAYVTITAAGKTAMITVRQSPRIKKSGLADITNYVSGVTSASAKCRMSVVKDYGYSVTEQGFCWSTSPEPTIDGEYMATKDTFAVLSGLDENTTYYVRSYAKNKKGISYGRQLEFITKSTIEKGERLAKGFLVNDTTQVYFSKGNLQYQASTGLWRFAENQNEMIGNTNSQASASYAGWIDLFGWGTSGSDVAPYMVTPSYSAYGDGEKDIANTRYDWGVYNAIGNSASGEWRTLTNAEWSYLLFSRPNAKELRGLAMVAGIVGLVILPDKWVLPEECEFESSATDYSTNSYSSLQWLLMQQQGAAFLPAAGNRYNTTVKEFGTMGYYWSSTASGESSAYSISFNEKSVSTDRSYRIYGRSVRLVQNL